MTGPLLGVSASVPSWSVVAGADPVVAGLGLGPAGLAPAVVAGAWLAADARRQFAAAGAHTTVGRCPRGSATSRPS